MSGLRIFPIYCPQLLWGPVLSRGTTRANDPPLYILYYNNNDTINNKQNIVPV